VFFVALSAKKVTVLAGAVSNFEVAVSSLIFNFARCGPKIAFALI